MCLLFEKIDLIDNLKQLTVHAVDGSSTRGAGLSTVMKMIRECCCHVVSDAGPNDRIVKRLDHTCDTEKACHQCASSCVGLVHQILQISIHSLSNCRYKAFHQYVSFDGPSNGWTLCNFCHNQGDHRYEWVASFSVWPF